MKRTTFLILFSVVFALTVLVICVYFWGEIKNKSEDIPFLEDVRERTDIIVSDRVSLGCFIPPDIDKTDFKNLKGNLKTENKTMWDNCFIVEKKQGFSGEDKEIEWQDINDSLPHGIKLNGYCYNFLRPGCLCLDKDVPGWEGKDFLTERRSLDFGTEYKSSIGKDLEKQSFVEIRGQPSVIVVEPGKKPKLSLYGGIKLRGEKTVEKVSARIFNSTSPLSRCKEECGDDYEGKEQISCEEGCKFANLNAEKADDCDNLNHDKKEGCKNFVSFLDDQPSNKIAGRERSCYIGDNWDCYKDCRTAGTESDCRIECDCYTEQRYYDEDSSKICENYCNSEDFEGDSGNCILGCKKGKEMNCYRDCFVETGNAKDCEDKCGCYYCNDTFKDKEFDLANYLFCEEESVLTGDDQKHGCEKFLKIEKSTFQIKTGNYSTFKIGNLDLKPDYRGLAWAVATITTKEPHPGESCYNPNNYCCYSQCCDEVCEYSDIGCKGEDNKCKDENDCDKRCNCSTTHRTDSELDNPFVLCKTFCASRDGYYGNGTKITKCQEGCEWAARQYNKPEFITFQKTVDLVFVTDTSGSMDGEWDTLCDIIDDIKVELEEEDYKLNITLYALGEKSKRIGVTPSCPYVLLNCSDINSDLGLSLDCSDSNCYMESWGPGAEWAVKNHSWREDILSKILFVASDEFSFCGGVSCSTNDSSSVKKAADAAIENNVTIFGLWGNRSTGISSQLKDLFYNISEPTGGNATLFSSPPEVKDFITNTITGPEKFEVGYDKFVNLTKEENIVSVDNPYVWRNVYDEVWSNPIYIVDWDKSSGNPWTYPCKGDWSKICATSEFNKSFEMNNIIEEIKDLYE